MRRSAHARKRASIRRPFRGRPPSGPETCPAAQRAARRRRTPRRMHSTPRLRRVGSPRDRSPRSSPRPRPQPHPRRHPLQRLAVWSRFRRARFRRRRWPSRRHPSSLTLAASPTRSDRTRSSSPRRTTANRWRTAPVVRSRCGPGLSQATQRHVNRRRSGPRAMRRPTAPRPRPARRLDLLWPRSARGPRVSRLPRRNRDWPRRPPSSPRRPASTRALATRGSAIPGSANRFKPRLGRRLPTRWWGIPRPCLPPGSGIRRPPPAPRRGCPARPARLESTRTVFRARSGPRLASAG